MLWDDDGPLSFQPSPAIRPAKAAVVRVLMALIMFLTGTYVGVDWASYYYGFATRYSMGAGFVRTVLCAALAWSVGENHVHRRDARLLGAAFAVTVVADYLIILHDQMMIGTLLFLLVHFTYIARHGQGFRASLAPERRDRTLRFLAISALVVYGLTGVLIWRVAPILARSGVLVIDSIYLFVVATSMWMAWGVFARDYYDRRNALYIAVGMTSFFICDVAVGVAAALGATSSGRVLGNAVGFFYTPALVLVAYSGYKWLGPGAVMSRR